MHEWALAESVIKAAENYSKQNGLKKVSSVNVVFGRLQGIDREIFGFAVKELLSGCSGVMKGARVKMETEDAFFKCNSCGAEFSLGDVKRTEDEAEFIHFVPEMAHTYIKCVRCGSPDFEIIRGRGVYIKSIKGEK